MSETAAAVKIFAAKASTAFRARRAVFADVAPREPNRSPFAIAGLLILAVLLLLPSCRGKDPPPPESWVALVNGDKIGLGEYQARLAAETVLVKSEVPLNAREIASLQEEVLDRMIEERIMARRARELSLAVGEEELEAKIEGIRRDYIDDPFESQFGPGGVHYPVWREALRKRILFEKLIAVEVNAKITVTDEEAQRYHRANRKEYLTEKRVRAAQIVVRDRERAESILKRLKAGEDFDKVAREVSIGPEASRGGDLGYFARGVMPEAIDRVVFTLPKGKISGVVQSPFGYHIFRLLEREEAGGRKFSEVKELVIADLRKLKEAEEYERWIERIKVSSTIQVNRPLPAWAPAVDAEGAGVPAANGGKSN
jgi:parvulin-like peptidyl-prolyl isomerase